MHEEPTQLSTEDARLDEELRRALEPHPAAVARVVHGALRGPATPRRQSWRLAVVGAFLLLMALTIPRLLVEPPPVDTAPTPAKRQLRISNEDGLVTVTTPTGSALVILSGEPL